MPVEEREDHLGLGAREGTRLMIGPCPPINEDGMILIILLTGMIMAVAIGEEMTIGGMIGEGMITTDRGDEGEIIDAMMATTVVIVEDLHPNTIEISLGEIIIAISWEKGRHPPHLLTDRLTDRKKATRPEG